MRFGCWSWDALLRPSDLAGIPSKQIRRALSPLPQKPRASSHARAMKLKWSSSSAPSTSAGRRSVRVQSMGPASRAAMLVRSSNWSQEGRPRSAEPIASTRTGGLCRSRAASGHLPGPGLGWRWKPATRGAAAHGSAAQPAAFSSTLRRKPRASRSASRLRSSGCRPRRAPGGAAEAQGLEPGRGDEAEAVVELGHVHVGEPQVRARPEHGAGVARRHAGQVVELVPGGAAAQRRAHLLHPCRRPAQVAQGVRPRDHERRGPQS